jgi:hypothetical protein
MQDERDIDATLQFGQSAPNLSELAGFNILKFPSKQTHYNQIGNEFVDGAPVNLHESGGNGQIPYGKRGKDGDLYNKHSRTQSPERNQDDSMNNFLSVNDDLDQFFINSSMKDESRRGEIEVEVKSSTH